MVPDEVAGFGSEMARELTGVLGPALVGVYFVGSVALGGYVAGESDVDVIGVTRDAVPEGVRVRVVETLLETTAHCPARGLEFTLYRREVVGSRPRTADFELNVNGGPRMPVSVHLDQSTEPGFWYVLDRAVAHRAGVRIVGPPAADTFVDIPRGTLLGAMRESMRWHRRHEGATLYSVLNACRAWRFAADDALGSKLEGAAWARERWSNREVVDSAVALRQGRTAELIASDVDALLEHVELTLSAAAERSADRSSGDAWGS